MKLIAEHWADLSMCAFLAFVGVVLLVYSWRDFRSQKRGGSSVP